MFKSLPMLSLLQTAAALPAMIAEEMPKLLQQHPRGFNGIGRGGRHFNRCTNWKARLKGQTNGKRECARRVRQMARVA